MEKVFRDLDAPFPPPRPVSQTYSLQDKHQKLCDSRYQEQRNKLGTLGVKKILIKIELAPCADSATLLIVILTVMQVEMSRLSRRRFIFLQGWRLQPRWRRMADTGAFQGCPRGASRLPSGP